VARVLFIGMGDVGSQTLDLFVRTPGHHTFLVAGRTPDAFRARVNLSLFAAMQLRHTPEIQFATLDLHNVEQTAEVITQFKPDLIFCAATLQKWGAINELPPPVRDQISQAQIGPWLPLQLLLVSKLMQAAKHTGLSIKVINATYPDVVHTVLHKVGLAPTTGIGDLANNIPALRVSVASKFHVTVDQVDVRLVAPHHVHYYMSRKGTSDGAPFHFTARVNGEDVTAQLRASTLFHDLPQEFKRAPGNQMTAASAAAIFAGMVNDLGNLTHAPGPNGLPGSYPVRVSQNGVRVELPDRITLDEAINLNTTGQQFDGIERIEEDGTVWFVERHMAVLKTLLGYECRRMPLAEVEERAQELLAKYNAFAQGYQ
jgi:hypothetical protein